MSGTYTADMSFLDTSAPYVVNAPLTVAAGATLTVGPGVKIVVNGNQTLTINGTATIASGDTLTLDASPYASSTQVVVGGTLSLNGVTVTHTGGYTTGLTVNGGGELVAKNTTFSLGSVTLSSGVVFNPGDLSGDTFNQPLYLPASDVALLSAAGGGADNVSFQDINILGGTLTGALKLAAIGTGGTASLRYVFPAGLTVATGASITTDPNLSVLLPGNQTLTVNGSASFSTNDTLTLDASPYASSTQVVVAGTLSLNGATVTHTGGYTTGLTINGGGELVAKNTVFSVGQVTLSSGVVFKSGDLSGDTFNQPLYLPASDVAMLSAAGGGADNQSFQDVNILGGTLTGSLKLSAIGKATTASLRWVFPAGQTVAAGASITVDPNLPVLLPGNQTLTINGSATFSTNDTLTLDASPYASSTQVVVNGTLSLTGATVTHTGGYTTGLTVNTGGRLVAANTTFSVGQVNLNNGAVFNPGDLSGDTFNQPVYLPAADVALLSASGGGADNQSFQDVDILGGTVPAYLELSPIGVATTASLRYVFSGPLTVNVGAQLVVDPNVPVLLAANQTLTINGSASLSTGDTLTLDASPYASSTQVVVNGALTAGGATVTHAGGYTTGLTVGSGGSLVANNSNFSLSSVSVLLAGRPSTGKFGSVTETGSQFGTSFGAHLASGFTPTPGDAYTAVHVAGTEAAPGAFGTTTQGATLSVDGSTFTVNYIDGDGNDTVLVAGTAVTANSQDASDGTTTTAQGQRSVVKDLLVTFNGATTLSAGALTLSQLNTGGSGRNDGSAPTDATAALGTPVAVSGSNNVWSIPVLAGTAFSGTTGGLNDGTYVLGVAVPGGVAHFTFHRLFGDFDGNGTVNALDYAQFKRSFGATAGSSQYNTLFDIDGNGTINALDYAQFKKRFGATLS